MRALTLRASDVEAETEAIRLAVRALPDEDRAAYFRLTERRMKDPDTYATLNWSLVAGAHHAYLGNWLRFAIDLMGTLLAVALLFTPLLFVGIALLVLILGSELVELARSQVMVADHNNAIARATLAEVAGPGAVPAKA